MYVASIDGATKRVLWTMQTDPSNSNIEGEAVAIFNRNNTEQLYVCGEFLSNATFGHITAIGAYRYDLFIARIEVNGAVIDNSGIDVPTLIIIATFLLYMIILVVLVLMGIVFGSFMMDKIAKRMRYNTTIRHNKAHLSLDDCPDDVYTPLPSESNI